MSDIDKQFDAATVKLIKSMRPFFDGLAIKALNHESRKWVDNVNQDWVKK